MVARITAVNPELLRWARERAGLSIDDVAARLKKQSEAIEAWESGETAPTYRQLEKLAYELYKRPLAVFFFASPPSEDDPKSEFRTLPENELDTLEPDTLYAIREARAMQESLKSLTGGIGPAERKVFVDIDPREYPDLVSLAQGVRAYLGIDLQEQISWRSTRDAFTRWRTVVQKNGVFVFKRSLKQRDVSGFCLIDSEFPVILINNSTAESRQVFSLFHELAHILHSVSGLTKVLDPDLSRLPPGARRIEMACNSFTAQFLVPDNHFDRQLAVDGATSEEELARLADLYSVSREVILRKLLDRGMVEQQFYESKAREWARQYGQGREREGGNYYATQAAYLGDAFLQLAFSKYYSGQCTLQELATHVKMKARNVQRLEEYLT